MKRAAGLAFLLAVQLVGAPPPKLIREIGLNQIIQGRPEFASAALAFSPDDNWIAMVGSYQFGSLSGAATPLRPFGSASVFLVPRNGPVDQRIQIDTGLASAEGAVWSPDSNSFFVQGLTGNVPGQSAGRIAKLWNIRGEESWRRGTGTLKDPPVPMFFLDAEHLLAGRILSKRPAPGFDIFNLQGQVVDMWAPPKQWRIVDISPDRHLLAVLSDRQAAQTLVVDYPSEKIILTEGNPYQDLRRVAEYRQTLEYFTEGGKTLCSVGSARMGDPETKFDIATECWDVDSGKSIAKFDGFRGGAPAAASSRGSRLILTHYTEVPGYGSPDYLGAEYVVWDFRSGRQVATWKPQPPSTIVPPRLSGIAISSTGRYVAEIVGDVLRIYELP